MAERLIFHVDVNSAYLSWEATRRVKNGEEDLCLVPSAIGGDPKSRRGVVLAKSIPAKKFGVKTGEPIALALADSVSAHMRSEGAKAGEIHLVKDTNNRNTRLRCFQIMIWRYIP